MEEQLNQERKVINGQRVMVARYSPDGRYIAVAGGEQESWRNSGFVSIYDAYSLTQVQERKHPFEVTCLDWSPDGRHIAYGGKEGAVCIWDPATDTHLSYCDHSPELAHLPSSSDPKRRDVFAVAWMHDGQHVTSAGLDGFVRTWQAESGKTVHAVYYENLSYRFVYAPGGIQAAAAPVISTRGQTGAILYDIEGGLARCSLLQRELSLSFAWAPPGIQRLATGGWHHIQIWDTCTATLLLTLPCDLYIPASCMEPSLSHLVWSPDASHIACCVRWNYQHPSLSAYGRGWSKAVVEINSTTDGMMQCAYATTDPYCLDWSPRGDQLVVGGTGGFEILHYTSPTCSSTSYGQKTF